MVVFWIIVAYITFLFVTSQTVGYPEIKNDDN